MKILLFILALTVPAAAQIDQLLKQGANVTLKDDSLVFVPVKFEPCNLTWQIKHKTFSREVTINLADLDAERFRVEPVKEHTDIAQLMLYTLNSRELIKEQTIYPDESRSDVNHKSVHVLLVKSRPIANKLSQAFKSATAKCMEQKTGATP